jgi:hypothetical protein
MGDKSPKAKQRDKNQKSKAEVDAKAKKSLAETAASAVLGSKKK